jgi:hypothetical protein
MKFLSTLPRRIAPLYNGGMSTPVIIAALAREPRRNPRAIQQKGGRGEGKKRPDNYRAQAGKKAAGAPLGNRNAAARGAQRRDRHAELDTLVQQMSTLADAMLDAARERDVLAVLLAGAGHG